MFDLAVVVVGEEAVLLAAVGIASFCVTFPLDGVSSSGVVFVGGLIHPASAWLRRRASVLIRRMAATCDLVLGSLEDFGRRSQFMSSAGWGPWQWMHLGGHIWPFVAAHCLVWLCSECIVDPQIRHRGGDAHTRLLCHSQQREHCVAE